MPRTDLAPPTAVDTTLIMRLTSAVEQLTVMQAAADLELRCFTPEQAAAILGKSPRLTAAHIRQIQAQGEVLPNKYAKPIAA